MSELPSDSSERPGNESLIRRLARGAVLLAYEQMGLPPDRATKAYEEQATPMLEVPRVAAPSPADIAKAAKAYDPDRLAKNFRGSFTQH